MFPCNKVTGENWWKKYFSQVVINTATANVNVDIPVNGLIIRLRVVNQNTIQAYMLYNNTGNATYITASANDTTMLFTGQNIPDAAVGIMIQNVANYKVIMTDYVENDHEGTITYLPNAYINWDVIRQYYANNN